MEKLIITKHNLEEITGKFLDGRASELERAALLKWRKENLDNESNYQEICRVNQKFTNLSQGKIDVDKAWNRVSSQLNLGKKPEKKGNTWSIVPLVLLVFIAMIVWGGIYLSNQNPKDDIRATAEGLDHILHDGSKVHLNPNSALSQIDGAQRKFKFSGQGRFEVEHDDAEHFTLHVGNVVIEDLGTVFDVKAHPQSDTIFVKVTDGIVAFYTSDNIGIQLVQGEEGMYIKSRNKFYKRSIDKENAVLDITFTETTLQEVLDHLSYSFRRDIEVANQALNECKLTVEFEDAPFDLVKDIIQETLGVSFRENISSITVTGDSCQ